MFIFYILISLIWISSASAAPSKNHEAILCNHSLYGVSRVAKATLPQKLMGRFELSERSSGVFESKPTEVADGMHLIVRAEIASMMKLTALVLDTSTGQERPIFGQENVFPPHESGAFLGTLNLVNPFFAQISAAEGLEIFEVHRSPSYAAGTYLISIDLTCF